YHIVRALVVPVLFFYCACDTPHLHSFPTRRSSDLRGLAALADRPNHQRLTPAHVAGGIDAFDGGLVAEGIGKQIAALVEPGAELDRKSTRLNSSHVKISYAVFCLKKKKKNHNSRID